MGQGKPSDGRVDLNLNAEFARPSQRILRVSKGARHPAELVMHGFVRTVKANAERGNPQFCEGRDRFPLQSRRSARSDGNGHVGTARIAHQPNQVVAFQWVAACEHEQASELLYAVDQTLALRSR